MHRNKKHTSAYYKWVENHQLIWSVLLLFVFRQVSCTADEEWARYVHIADNGKRYSVWGMKLIVGCYP